MQPKIAISISTRNREESLYKLIESISMFMPEDCVVMVVDDASEKVYAWPDYRFEQPAGISRVKNKCLELCMQYESVQHIFLMDDDIRILKNDWHLPYINSGQHHLATTFYKPYKTDGNLNVFRAINGYCLYFTRHCIETVGGFDTRFNNKFEHTDLSRRIYNARLTNYPYQDVIGSNEFIYSLDQDQAIQRSFTKQQMDANLKSGYDLFYSKQYSSDYIDFKT